MFEIITGIGTVFIAVAILGTLAAIPIFFLNWIVEFYKAVLELPRIAKAIEELNERDRRQTAWFDTTKDPEDEWAPYRKRA